MIYFNINIRNPKWWNRFESLWNKFGTTPFEHKFWEVQFIKSPELFRVEFNWNVQEDHAGIRLELGLLGYQLDLSFYDNRHWNIEKSQWHNTNKESDRE
jgi:hypothetical protein